MLLNTKELRRNYEGRTNQLCFHFPRNLAQNLMILLSKAENVYKNQLFEQINLHICLIFCIFAAKITPQ